MKLLISYALLADMDDLLKAATLAGPDGSPTYRKISEGRRLSRGCEIVVDETDREVLLTQAHTRILCARQAMKEQPLYWRPLLAAWRALEQRLINDWPNVSRLRAA